MKVDKFTKGLISNLKKEDKREETIDNFYFSLNISSSFGAVAAVSITSVLGVVYFPESVLVLSAISAVIGFLANYAYLRYWKYGKIIKRYF